MAAFQGAKVSATAPLPAPLQASQTLPDGRVRARNLLLSEKMLPVRPPALALPDAHHHRNHFLSSFPSLLRGRSAPLPRSRTQGENWLASAERAVAEELGSAFKGKPSGAHFREESVTRMNVSKESPSYPGAHPVHPAEHPLACLMRVGSLGLTVAVIPADEISPRPACLQLVICRAEDCVQSHDG